MLPVMPFAKSGVHRYTCDFTIDSSPLPCELTRATCPRSLIAAGKLLPKEKVAPPASFVIRPLGECGDSGVQRKVLPAWIPATCPRLLIDAAANPPPAS